MQDVSLEDPDEVFANLVSHGWNWEIDYSQATDEEAFNWRSSEVAVRILRALFQGRPVTYMGKVYSAKSPEEAREVAFAIEDEMVASERLLGIERDDEAGLVLGDYDAV